MPFARCWFIFIFCWLCIGETSFVFIYARCLLYLAGARLELQADAMDFHFAKVELQCGRPALNWLRTCWLPLLFFEPQYNKQICASVSQGPLQAGACRQERRASEKEYWAPRGPGGIYR